MASKRAFVRTLAQTRSSSSLLRAQTTSCHCSRTRPTLATSEQQRSFSDAAQTISTSPVARATFQRGIGLQQRRRLSNDSGSKPKVYEFGDIKALTTKPDPSKILIDVREPSEYGEGFIPTAHNMPLKTQPDALFLPEDEFEDRFGFPKPDKEDEEVIFYCRSGVRSSAAAKLAEQGGYEKIGEYKGSWLDWVENGGQAEKPSK